MFRKLLKKNINIFSEKSPQSDDPFLFLRTVFIDAGYTTVAEKINYFCIVFHTSSYLLEMNYLIQHFTLNTLLKHGCGMLVMIYVSVLIFNLKCINYS